MPSRFTRYISKLLPFILFLLIRNYGLVLFHLSHVWIDGKQLSTDRIRSALTLGTWVSFYDQVCTITHSLKL